MTTKAKLFGQESGIGNREMANLNKRKVLFSTPKSPPGETYASKRVGEAFPKGVLKIMLTSEFHFSWPTMGMEMWGLIHFRFFYSFFRIQCLGSVLICQLI